MRKAGGILGIIGGVFAVIAAVITLFLGGFAAAVHGATTQDVANVVGLGLLAAFLAIIFGAIALGTSARLPGVLLLLSAGLGIGHGGLLVAVCMALVAVGGILAIAGAKSAPQAAMGDGVGVGSPRPRKGWRIAGYATGGLIMLVIIAAALGGKSSSTAAKAQAKPSNGTKATPAQSTKAAPAHAAASAPIIVVGDTFSTNTFQVTVNKAVLLSEVGDGFMNDKPAQGAEYVAVVWTYKNVSNKPANTFDTPSVYLLDAHGTKYDEDDDASSTFETQIHATAKTLSDSNPGVTYTDGAVFEVSTQLFNPNTWQILVRSGDGDVDVRFVRPAPNPAPAPAPATKPAPAVAPPAASKPVMSAAVSTPGTMQTPYGNVSVDNDSMPPQLLVNGRPLKPSIEGNQSLQLLKQLQFQGNTAILLQDTGGSACPALFRWVLVGPHTISYTPEFGSCSDLVKLTSSAAALTLTMPDPNTGTATVFSFDGLSLKQDGKPVQ